MDRRPIGVFDSGLGGLTVVREIGKALPGEEIIYFGDTARVPYGTKSKETITRFSKENVKFLLKFKVKLIVVACNTASSLSLSSLKRSFKVPIIGVIKPGVKRALEVTDKGPIGVIGTRSTIASDSYQKLIKASASGMKVIGRPCPLFVPLVEEGWLDNKITSSVMDEYLGDFKKRRVETLILGCTHYPLLKKSIRRSVGGGVKLIDSASETARAVKCMLKEKGLLSDRKRFKNHKYFVSDEPAIFRKIGSRFLGSRIKEVKVALT